MSRLENHARENWDTLCGTMIGIGGTVKTATDNGRTEPPFLLPPYNYFIDTALLLDRYSTDKVVSKVISK